MTQTARPYAVLFDLDGTLIDSIGLLLACMKHTFDGRTHAPTEAEWIAGLGTPLAKQLEPFAADMGDVETMVSRYRTFQADNHDRMMSAYDGTVEVLEELDRTGHPMGVVTSKGNRMMTRGLEFTGIARFMKSAIGCASCHIHKPDPFPVRMALRELGYESHEAVFVGDSPHDVTAGNAAGVTTIAALWGPFTRETLEPFRPSHFLESIRGLPDLVARIEHGSAG